MTDISRPRKLEAMLETSLWRLQGHALDSSRPRVLIISVGGQTGSLLSVMTASAAQGAASAGGQAMICSLNSELSPGIGLKNTWKAAASLANQVQRLAAAWKPSAVVIAAGDEEGLVAALRGMARLDLPTVAVMAPGSPWDPQWKELLARGVEVEKSKESLESWLAALETFMGSDLGGAWHFPSGFRYLLEPLGLAVAGAGALQSQAGAQDAARRSGWQAVRLANAQVPLSQVLTQTAFQNALAVHASLGGGSSAIWRLLQLAGELGASVKASWLSPKKVLDFTGSQAKQRSPEAFQADGGVAGLMLLLLEHKALDGSARDVSRRRWYDSLPETAQPETMRFFKQLSGQAVSRRDWLLRGNLAPLGMIANGPAAGAKVALPARVVDGEAAALELYRKSRVRADEILVVRALGQRLALLQVARGCVEPHWLLTDGLVDSDFDLDTAQRLPAHGGAWAAVKDGDLIKIDLAAGTADTDAVTGAETPRTSALDPLWAAELDRLRNFGFS